MVLRDKVLSGFGWMAGTKILSQAFSWAVTLIVVRLLSPGDYGLMAMATLVLTFLNLVSEMGLSSAIVQRKDISESIIRQCFGLILIFNFVLLTLVYLSAPFISAFFAEPELLPVVQVLALSFLITAFTIVPEALLEREMNFKKISIINLVSAVIAALITLVLALTGSGVWALVLGNIAMVLIKAIGYNFVNARVIIPSFSLVGMKSISSFGGMVALERTLLFFYTQADSFIIGKIFGKEILGIYSVAAHIASLPMQKISGVINQVAFPAFSSIQSDKQAVAQYVLKAARLMSFTTFPIFWGLSSVSPEFVKVILGEKWLDAILPLQLLTLIMPFRMLGNIMSPVLRGIGRADTAVINLGLSAVIMTSAFLIGTKWGLLGVCYAWLIAYPLVYSIVITRSMRVFAIPLGSYLKSLLKPGIAALGMYLSVYYARELLPAGISPMLQFIAMIAVGAVVYVLIIMTAAKDLKSEAFSLLKK